MAYEIGYRRPPKNTQFKPGNSGNPKGRPKGSKNFITLLEEELDQPVIVNENGRKKKLSRRQAMAKRIVADALQGDRKAIFLLLDVLRRMDRLASNEPPSLLPAGYEEILEAYVKRHHEMQAPPTDGEVS
jgi:hypothetical protein